MFKVRLPFYEMDGDMGAASSPSVEAGIIPGDGNAPTPNDNQDHTPKSAEDVSKQESFAKRLKESTDKAIAEERQKIEQEYSEKYKGHDDYKFVAEYLQEAHGKDLLSLKEKIEMEKLQERAEENEISPEMQRRLEKLEAKAAKGDELEQKLEQEQKTKQEEEQRQQAYTEFRGKLDVFAKEKEADADKLYAYMVENQIGNMEAAFKSMDYDNMQQKLQQAEKTGMKKLFAAKAGIPNVPNSNKSGQVIPTQAKTLAEARQRALARDFNSI